MGSDLWSPLSGRRYCKTRLSANPFRPHKPCFKCFHLLRNRLPEISFHVISRCSPVSESRSQPEAAGCGAAAPHTMRGLLLLDELLGS